MAGPLALAACSGADAGRPRPTATVTVAPKAVSLTVGFYGTQDEIAAYRQAVDNYDAANQTVTLKLVTWPSAAAMMDDLAAGKPAPDVFLADRGDLGVLQEGKLIQPVDDLLAARNVDLGDAYSREALEAFSADRHLTCMPYASTPQVLYYNSDLVDFPAMQAAGEQVPGNPDTGKWSLSLFSAAATWAVRPAAGVRAFALPNSVEGLAPYLYSGGGKVVDDESMPTTLAFSDPANQGIWDRLLPVFGAPGYALTPQQLRQRTPLQWFERGKLAMLVGDRSLVPQLREQPGLHWDVMALPSVSGSTTIGDYTGLCLSAGTKETQASADLLAYLVSRPAVALVAQAGYIVPASTEVAMSDDFLQSTQRPAHATVFVSAARSMRVLPLPTTTLAALDNRAGGLFADLFRPGADVPTLTAQIDSVSQPVLAALNAELHPSPTASPTAN